MSDKQYPASLPTITTCSVQGIGLDVTPTLPGATASGAVTTTSNEARYCPITLTSPYLVKLLFWVNGASVSGNVDVGIYSASGTRLVSTGSTVQAGTSTIQSVTLGTPLLLEPDLYYFAWCVDNTTAQMHKLTTVNGASDARRWGLFTQLTAFPLPATATFAACTMGAIAVAGFSSRTLI